MPTQPDPFAIDLQQGVVPISKAASSLAALIRLSQARHLPIVVTQKGYPTGVLLAVELFAALRALAEARSAESPEPAADVAPEPVVSPVVEEPAAPERKARGGRRAKAAS
jgi:prevent-host-death family protein